ncbi:hypothetical protein GURASL_33530 [Geotalea uraniireducens]|uniref:Uncharacterized protein n=1 Tax=Geotalea uraniireducens TaxID=351604 RepID=A0ABM8EPB7_9BACT|nr:hypothetical protein GURASL_33530 [Geotalea uraniireducens]
MTTWDTATPFVAAISDLPAAQGRELASKGIHARPGKSNYQGVKFEYSFCCSLLQPPVPGHGLPGLRIKLNLSVIYI